MIKMITLALVFFVHVFAFAEGKGDLNCFFLYQTPAGDFVTLDSGEVVFPWGTPKSYNLYWNDDLSSVRVYTEVRDVPHDYAFVDIIYSDASGDRKFAAQGDLKPDPSNRNQANLVLLAYIPKTMRNGQVVDKFYASCILTTILPTVR